MHPLVAIPLFFSTSVDVESTFRDTVRPFVETYCAPCHGQEKPKAGLNLRAFTSVDAVAADLGRWDSVLDQIQTAEMPPDEAERRPTPEARRQVVEWVQAL